MTKSREGYWRWGPVSLVVVGCVWSLECGPVGLVRVGQFFRFRLVKGWRLK